MRLDERSINWKPVYPEGRKLGDVISVGVWNISPGGGRFIPETREQLDLRTVLTLIKQAGATHVEFHDTEALPKDAEAIMAIVNDIGLKVGMCTANLFRRQEFVGGNFSHPNPVIRAAAVNYTKDYIAAAIDVFQAQTYVYWNGSNGICMPLAANYRDLYGHAADCLAEIVEWMVGEYGEDNAIPLCIEPKMNEPPGWGVPADVGEALSIISLLPEELQPFVGLNPETCHSQMAGKRYAMELGLAAAAGKLYHVHLNGGSGAPKFDEDRAFGDIDFGVAVETMFTLREIGYQGLLGLDVQPLPMDTNAQQAASIERSIRNLRRAIACSDRLWEHKGELDAARLDGDQGTVSELFTQAVCGL